MNPDNFNAEDYLELILHPEAKEKREAGLFTSTYTAQQYKDDLDEFGTQLTTINPSAYKFISKEDFWKVVEEKKALMTDNTTFAEFRWHCNEILANVNCSHTSMGSFYPEHRMLPKKLQFPLITRLVNDSLFVIDPMNNSEWVKKMDQIETINGVEVAELITEIYKRIPSQGHIESTKRLDFNKWSSGYLAYALNFPEHYEITTTGGVKSITLKENEENKDPISDYSIAYCGNDLCLEMMDNNTAMLTISSFNYYKGNTYMDFVEFMDDAFDKIKTKDVEHLILDLRFNGGGSPESSVYLLRYLLNEPFVYFPGNSYPGANGIQQLHKNRFKGKVYCVIDGHGNSTTGHFMAMIKDKERAEIIGEELGSNHFCTAGYNHTLRLKNTRL
ncbi:MAG: S41 family peptidase, partial [Flavobacteriales bacterium]